MDNRVNFTLVGIFVTIVTTLFFVSLYWIIKPSNAHKLTTYVLLATESINGVNVGTNVKYQGLNIGRVKNFRINPNKPSEIILYLEIDKEVPIQNGVVASIKPQGITGLSYIDIHVVNNAHPLKEITFMNQTYTLIPFKTSTLNNLTHSAQDIGQELQHLLQKMSYIISKNEQNTDLIIHQLALSTQQLNKLLSDKNINNLSALISQTHTLVKKTQKLVDDYSLLANKGQKTLDKINLSIDNGEYNLKEISGTLPSESAQLIKELRVLSRELSSSLQTFEDDPSAILFKSSTPNPGPGEKQ